jgi:hypothetical protein
MRGEGHERPWLLGGEEGIEEPAQRLPQIVLLPSLPHAHPPANSFSKLSCFQAPAGTQLTTRTKDLNALSVGGMEKCIDQAFGQCEA